MRTPAIILVVGSAIILAMSGIHAPVSSEAAPTPEEAAEEGFKELSELVTPDTAKGLGFTSTSEVSAALLDTTSALRAYTVELDVLRKFKRGDDAKILLKDRDVIIYTIKVGESARSSMTVTRLQDGTWDVTGWGAPGFIAGLSRLAYAGSKNIVVWIPELYIYFLGEYEQNGKLMLVPIYGRPELNLEISVWKSAHDVFLQLSNILPTVKPYKPGSPAKPRVPG